MSHHIEVLKSILNGLKFVQGAYDLKRGQYDELRLKMPFRPLHAWIKVFADDHCGGTEVDIVGYELTDREVVIAAEIGSAEVTVYYTIVGVAHHHNQH